jgi:hypothetical protein
MARNWLSHHSPDHRRLAADLTVGLAERQPQSPVQIMRKNRYVIPRPGRTAAQTAATMRPAMFSPSQASSSISRSRFHHRKLEPSMMLRTTKIALSARSPGLWVSMNRPGSRSIWLAWNSWNSYAIKNVLLDCVIELGQAAILLG